MLNVYVFASRRLYSQLAHEFTNLVNILRILLRAVHQRTNGRPAKKEPHAANRRETRLGNGNPFVTTVYKLNKDQINGSHAIIRLIIVGVQHHHYYRMCGERCRHTQTHTLLVWASCIYSGWQRGLSWITARTEEQSLWRTKKFSAVLIWVAHAHRTLHSLSCVLAGKYLHKANEQRTRGVRRIWNRRKTTEIAHNHPVCIIVTI